MTKARKLIISASVVATAIIITVLAMPTTAADTFVMKFGTMAPRGTVLAKAAQSFRSNLEKKSGGKIKVKIFGGGKAGSEKAMIKKLQQGNLQMASFTGIGLGQIVPMVRVLELPFFFKNSKQVDKVVAKLLPDFEKEFEKKGFIVAGWAEIGPVYLMSKKPIAKFKDMEGVKIWAPAGDQLVKAMFKEYGLVPVYLSFESVLPQLQTGGLDAIYGPPVAAIGLQWYREVKFISDAELANATGANLISKKAFDKMPPDLQKIVKETAAESAKNMVKAIRRDNTKGLAFLKKRLKVVKVNPADLATLKKRALAVQNKLVGKLYPKSILDKAKAAR